MNFDEINKINLKADIKQKKEIKQEKKPLETQVENGSVAKSPSNSAYWNGVMGVKTTTQNSNTSFKGKTNKNELTEQQKQIAMMLKQNGISASIELITLIENESSQENIDEIIELAKRGLATIAIIYTNRARKLERLTDDDEIYNLITKCNDYQINSISKFLSTLKDEDIEVSNKIIKFPNNYGKQIETTATKKQDDITIEIKHIIYPNDSIKLQRIETYEDGTTSSWFIGEDDYYNSDANIVGETKQPLLISQTKIISNPETGEPTGILATKKSEDLNGAYETVLYTLKDYPESFNVLETIKNGTIEGGKKLSGVIKNPDGSITYSENIESNGITIQRVYTQSANGIDYDYKYSIVNETGTKILDANISFIKKSSNETSTIINGKEYTAIFDDSNYTATITSSDGATETLDIGAMITENKAECFATAKNLPANLLRNLMEVKTWKYTPSDGFYGITMTNSILWSSDNVPAIAHELGHAMNNTNSIIKNQELVEIYNKECEAFKKTHTDSSGKDFIDYFLKPIDNYNRGLSEIIAETNMLITTYGHTIDEYQTRAQILAQNFPKTIAFIATELGMNTSKKAIKTNKNQTSTNPSFGNKKITEELTTEELVKKHVAQTKYKDIYTQEKCIQLTKYIDTAHEKLTQAGIKITKENVLSLASYSLDRPIKVITEIGDSADNQIVFARMAIISRLIQNKCVSLKTIGDISISFDTGITKISDCAKRFFSRAIEKAGYSQKNNTFNKIADLIAQGTISVDEANKLVDNIEKLSNYDVDYLGLSPEQQKVATTLKEEGYSETFSIGGAKLSEAELKTAKELIQQGYRDSFSASVAKLESSQRTSALKLVDAGINTLNSLLYARKITPEQADIIIKMKNEAGFDIAKTSIYVKKMSTEQVNTAIKLKKDDEFSDSVSLSLATKFSPEQIEKAKKLKKDGINETDIIDLVELISSQPDNENKIISLSKNEIPVGEVKRILSSNYDDAKVELIGKLYGLNYYDIGEIGKVCNSSQIEAMSEFLKVVRKRARDIKSNIIQLQNEAGTQVEVTAKGFMGEPSSNPMSELKQIISSDGSIRIQKTRNNGDGTTSSWYINGDNYFETTTQNIDDTEQLQLVSQTQIINDPKTGEPTDILLTKLSDKLNGVYEKTLYTLKDYPEDYDVLEGIKSGTIKGGKKLSSVIAHRDGSRTYNENLEINGCKIERKYVQASNGIDYKYQYQITDETGAKKLNTSISFAKNSDNQTTTVINGKKFTAIFDDVEHKVQILTPEGTTKTLDISKMASDSDLKDCWAVAKTLPSNLLEGLMNIGKWNYVYRDMYSSVEKDNSEISIRDNPHTIAHEIGHSIDHIIHLSSDEELIKIYNAEFETYNSKYTNSAGQDHVKYFSHIKGGLHNTGLSEVVAETNMILTSFGTNSSISNTRGQLLAQNFPKTISYIATKLGMNNLS